MAKEVHYADASPEKRLFVSLITRDITLHAAFLDLVDNSINSALEPFAERLTSADGYLELYYDNTITPSVDITIEVNENYVMIADTASGISLKAAEEEVFRFGRPATEQNSNDRLSVYGIGLKRALFKLGNRIKVTSDHPQGGFDLDVDVGQWEQKPKGQQDESTWRFPLTPRTAAEQNASGTTIVIEELYDELKIRLRDGRFLNELSESIAKTYAYFTNKIADIYLNGSMVEKRSFDIGEFYGSKQGEKGNVSWNITAGIAANEGGHFFEKNAGWYVFCNGRNVVFADKSNLTGWGESGMPTFQPKHRPFIGNVYFVSQYPEDLPWTTTKSWINEDSVIWRQAKKQMKELSKVVIRFLDERYSEEGTVVPMNELARGSDKAVNALTAATSGEKQFDPPKPAKARKTKVQFHADVEEIKKVARAAGDPQMPAADVGRYVFNYFLRHVAKNEK